MIIAIFKDFGTYPFVKDLLFFDWLLYIIILFRTDVLIGGKTSLRSQVGMGSQPYLAAGQCFWWRNQFYERMNIYWGEVVFAALSSVLGSNDKLAPAKQRRWWILSLIILSVKKAPDSFAQVLYMQLIFTNMSVAKFVYLTDMPHGTVMKKVMVLCNSFARYHWANWLSISYPSAKSNWYAFRPERGTDMNSSWHFHSK